MNFKICTNFFLLVICLPLFFISASICECGDDNETTSYLVGSHGDCCDFDALVDGDLPAFTFTWEQQANGVWQVTSTSVSTSSAAQNKCCN